MKYISLFISLLLIFSISVAQETEDDFLNDLLEDGGPDYATAIFKASRIISGHSVKQPKKGELEFRISHRFGSLNGGAQELWGLDQASIHFSLEYSPIDRFTLGIGRSNYNKTYDGYAKAALLKQQKGERIIPVSVSYFTSIEVVTNAAIANEIEFKHRLSYIHQLLIARKISDGISIQLSPTLVHRNLSDNSTIPNDVYALGIGGRVKVANRLSINVETFLLSDDNLFESQKVYVPLSLGIDLETGGHVFQIMLSNALPMREAGFITETIGTWGNGDVHLGFNVSRMFNLH